MSTTITKTTKTTKPLSVEALGERTSALCRALRTAEKDLQIAIDYGDELLPLQNKYEEATKEFVEHEKLLNNNRLQELALTQKKAYSDYIITICRLRGTDAAQEKILTWTSSASAQWTLTEMYNELVAGVATINSGADSASALSALKKAYGYITANHTPDKRLWSALLSALTKYSRAKRVFRLASFSEFYKVIISARFASAEIIAKEKKVKGAKGNS